MTTLGIVVLVGLIFVALVTLVALVGDIVYDLYRHRLSRRTRRR